MEKCSPSLECLVPSAHPDKVLEKSPNSPKTIPAPFNLIWPPFPSFQKLVSFSDNNLFIGRIQKSKPGKNSNDVKMPKCEGGAISEPEVRVMSVQIQRHQLSIKIVKRWTFLRHSHHLCAIIQIQIQSINDDNWIFYVTVQHGSSLLPHLKSWENVRSQPTIAQCFNKCKFYGELEAASEIIQRRQKSVHLMRHRCRFPNEFKYLGVHQHLNAHCTALSLLVHLNKSNSFGVLGTVYSTE